VTCEDGKGQSYGIVSFLTILTMRDRSKEELR
jgi:hypothetical protein